MKIVPYLQALLTFAHSPGNTYSQIVIHDLESTEIPIIKSLCGTEMNLTSLMEQGVKITKFRLIPMMEKVEESKVSKTIYFNRLDDLLKRDDLVIHG